MYWISNMKVHELLDITDYNQYAVVQRYSNFDSRLGFLSKQTILNEMANYEVVHMDHVANFVREKDMYGISVLLRIYVKEND